MTWFTYKANCWLIKKEEIKKEKRRRRGLRSWNKRSIQKPIWLNWIFEANWLKVDWLLSYNRLMGSTTCDKNWCFQVNWNSWRRFKIFVCWCHLRKINILENSCLSWWMEIQVPQCAFVNKIINLKLTWGSNLNNWRNMWFCLKSHHYQVSWTTGSNQSTKVVSSIQFRIKTLLVIKSLCKRLMKLYC